MIEQETWSQEDAQAMHTDQSAVDEATRRETVRTDTYNVLFKSVKLPVADEKSPYPGRKMINTQIAANRGDDKPPFTMFVRLSPEPYRIMVTDGGERKRVKPGDENYSLSLKLDSEFNRWSEIEKYLNPDKEYSVGQVIEKMDGALLSCRISESFSDPNERGQFYNYKSEDERDSLVKAGLVPQNFAFRFGKPKDN